MEAVSRDALTRRVTLALLDSARRANVHAAIVDIRDRPWSSATFTGARHVVTLAAADGPARAAWLDALPEAEWRIPGHLVADLAVDERTAGTVRLALLILLEA